ncbi:VWA domain-containing protein [Bacillaceae bacterium SIJ1]|uniref:vWA domain-containing protein n=1 Tax=Litoribacterium kuwaitense TaxID=1398745 RepID=UPI0013EE3021|nr:BatA and WFA domain-containing protein [Litoribacterium kuwaitense]NGP44271.1 VWA domain-containing protein [Litoribacterium kuwaitense]
MGITAPWFLSLSIFLIGVILLYFFRRQYVPLTISSNLLWEQVMEEYQATRWYKRMQRHWLLLLQLIILSLLIGAMIQPYLYTEGIKGEQIIVVLDTSGSMAASHGDDANTFHEAIQQAKDVVSKKNATQQVTLLLTGPQPAIALQGETAKGKINKALDEAKLTYTGDHIQEALKLAEALSSRMPSSIHVFSDVAQSGDSETVVFHSVENQAQANAYVSAFGVRREGQDIGGVVNLRQTGRQELNGQLRVFAEDELFYDQPVSVSGEKPTTVTLSTVPQALYYKAEIVFEGDMLPEDNARFAFLGDEGAGPVYFMGDVPYFVEKVYQQLGHEVIQLQSANEATSMVDRRGLTVVAEADESSWPDGPKIIFAQEGGPFQLEEPESLEGPLTRSDTNALMSYLSTENIYIDQASRSEADAELTPVLESGEIPLILSGQYQGDPVVVLTFDIHDSNWPLLPSFPIFFYNAYETLQVQETHLGYTTPGEAMSLPSFVTQAKSIVDEAGDERVSLEGESEQIIAPEQPGLYKLQSGDELIHFAVHMPLEESQFTTEEMSAASDGMQEKAEAEGRYALWPWLIALGLIVLVIEGEVYRRGI